MKMKPLLANTQVVQNILAGRQTQDRRPIKGIPDDAWWVMYHGDDFLVEELRNKVSWFMPANGDMWPCNREDAIKPKYQVGDVLYVRETFQLMDDSSKGKDMAGIPKGRFLGEAAPWKGVCGDRAITWRPVFRADGELTHPEYGKIKWKPNIHMPKWAARIFLKVTAVRVERIQDITPLDCTKEGCFYSAGYGKKMEILWEKSPREVFCELWDSIYPGSWDRNDWVFVYEFERTEKEV